ncbi:Na+/H+ antiporter subunit E [Solwaraspora sp. WMMD406]|uniref:Na+/H+ antiporter subunit E n=1 Tax=Solwaraspora sp. WMMD406 TaxID=3016095 RepID=UPI002417E200|nr:Na+/H+ antiporter subunit E [Solwaraspora sp. WMMD406]MDG4767083.1 Na+/H+ antiporter subunit E [Solwaraspora sp. WMMD406]
MSPVSKSVQLRNQLIAVVVLVVLWNLFYGEFSIGNVIGGALVALAVITVFPLPPVAFDGRIRPVAVLVFLVRFVIDLFTASAQVAWTAVRFGHTPRSAVIAVRLRVRTDLNLTLTGEALSLIPGSLIVAADAATGTLYVHVLDVADHRDVEQAREKVLELEARIVRAVGSAAEVRQLDAPVPPPAPAVSVSSHGPGGSVPSPGPVPPVPPQGESA